MGIGIGTNGTIYTSGNAGSPVYAAYIVGVGETFDTSGSLSNALAAWAPQCPFTATNTYSLTNTTNSAQISFFDTPIMLLSISTTTSNILVLSWPYLFGHLQQNSDLKTTNWIASTNVQNWDGIESQVVVTNSGPRFFRLKYP